MVFDDSLMGQLIRFVCSHEVGHTLGLLHNFGASATVPVDSLRNKVWVESHGHTPSIMDYARFNYVAQPEDHIGQAGLFPRIGDYDKWAIEWGYRLFPQFTGPEEEKAFVNKLVIEHQANKRLRFGSERLIDKDPRDQNEDLGDDAMKAGEYGIRNLQYILPKLTDWTKTPDEGYDNLKRVYKMTLSQYNQYLLHVVRNVGGEYITPKSQEEEGAVVSFVPKEKQARAVVFLDRQLFRTPDWLLDKGIGSKLGMQPTALMGSLQNSVLDNLLSSRTINQLTDAETLEGSQAYTPLDLLHDLKKSIWSELATHATITVYRRNLQKEYIADLIGLGGLEKKEAKVGSLADLIAAITGPENSDATSLGRLQLRELQREIAVALPLTKDVLSRAHLAELEERIRGAFKE